MARRMVRDMGKDDGMIVLQVGISRASFCYENVYEPSSIELYTDVVISMMQGYETRFLSKLKVRRRWAAAEPAAGLAAWSCSP